MDETSKNELQLEAAKHYTALKVDAERIMKENQQAIEYNSHNPEEQKPLLKLSIQHKVIQFLELWYVRYILAASYVWLVPRVKEILSGKPSSDEGESEDEGNNMEMFEEFKNFMRFKKTLM
ncbi:MAG: hypothetical protein BGP13_19530 [Sphingobacteriales bacterium 40-81]|nr:MAG: hypothetical protein BGP13_19530 [Sphingobacteriales bacterium 40-81]